MNILKITKADLNERNEYTGSASLEFDGHIEIESGLGWVRFLGKVVARGAIAAHAGSGIEAGEGIKAGLGIKAGSGIEAGEGIKAGWGIEAGEGIKAGLGIKAGWGIEAGEGIKAGWGIEAGEGIEAGLSIQCKTLSSKLRIFAGVCLWKIPEDSEMEIRAESIAGQVCFGRVVAIAAERKDAK